MSIISEQSVYPLLRCYNQFMEERTFDLYIVSTPIGNLEDITLRALRILKTVDFILCEDTRQTVKLLNHYEIKKPLVSYHKFNEAEMQQEVIDRISSGEKAALVSDAGTPLLSDPGEKLVKTMIGSGISFCVLPGANALLPSLIMSGFDMNEFHFAGFLPSKKQERSIKLAEYLKSSCATVLYVSPHELRRVLNELEEIAPDRMLSLAKELTKYYENIYRGTASMINDDLGEEIKGEYTLTISPNQNYALDKEFSDEEIKEMFDELISKGMDRKGALQSVAKKTGRSKNSVYFVLFVKDME